MKKENSYSQETNILHAGYGPKDYGNSINPPITESSTFNFNTPEIGGTAFQYVLNAKGLNKIPIYGRINTPNAETLEVRLVSADSGAVEAAIFNTGMSAISTTLTAIKHVKHDTVFYDARTIACTYPVYGGTYQHFESLVKYNGFRIVELDADENAAHEQLKEIGSDLLALYIETPANPTLEMSNIDYLCTTAKCFSPGCYTILDNTFMGIFQQGFKISEHLDLIIYSATKFLGGHSDLLGGVVLCNEKNREIMTAIKGERIGVGTILQPHECSRLIGHIGTYFVRMRQEAENARQIAFHLESLNSKKIQKILYPDLLKPGDRNYDIYHNQCSGGSSIICLYLNTDLAGTCRFLQSVADSGIIQLAVSLGSVESLIEHPRSMTHSEMPISVLDQLKIFDNFLRFSVGLENPEDLIKVIMKALEAI